MATQRPATDSDAQRRRALAVAGVVGAGSVGLIFLGLRGKGGAYGPLDSLPPGHTLSCPSSPDLGVSTPSNTCEWDTETPIPLSRTTPNIPARNPHVLYKGAGLDTFTILRVVQKQGDRLVTTHGSGVAAVFLGPSPTEPTDFNLVAVDEPQPLGCPATAPGQTGGNLCAGQYPGFDPSPICNTATADWGPVYGGPAVAGPADALIEIYLCDFRLGDPRFPECFASPYCNPRRPVKRLVVRNRYSFT